MYNDFFKSNNEAFIGAVESIDNDKVKVDIISSDKLDTYYSITLPGSIGGERFAVSDDGNLVASAVYSDYGKGIIVVYSNNEKRVIFETTSFKRVDWIDFKNESILMIGEKNKICLYNYIEGSSETQKNYRIVKNAFGEDIILYKENMLLLKEKKIKSKTFSFFTPIGVTDGVVISETCGDVIKYLYNGKMHWELNIAEYGHALKCYYMKSQNVIMLDVFNYRNGGSSFITVDNKTGNILNVNSFESNKYIVITQENGHIIDYNGNVYNIDECYNWVLSHKL